LRNAPSPCRYLDLCCEPPFRHTRLEMRKSPRRSSSKRFAVCVENRGNEASLILGKVYRVRPDARAPKDDLLRVVDESGEDYLFAADQFVLVDFPEAIRRRLRALERASSANCRCRTAGLGRARREHSRRAILFDPAAAEDHVRRRHRGSTNESTSWWQPCPGSWSFGGRRRPVHPSCVGRRDHCWKVVARVAYRGDFLLLAR
jgi:hypothetical protein